MALAPDYGETPVPGDELVALLPSIREFIGTPVTRAELYDLEQGVQEEVAERLAVDVLEGRLSLDLLLTDRFLRDLHVELYGDIWSWAGRLRTHELNIGVAPEHVSVELHSSMETILYRREHTTDWTARQLGIVAHAETVRIHPFVDGNGRTTRLLADLVYFASQADGDLQQYDWEFDKNQYIRLLREYDATRDVRDLASFVPIRPLDD